MLPLPAPTAIVVDDEPLMRDQIITQLREAWPELVIAGEAGNGREAIALAQSVEPDIAFLDIRMPAMDGIQAAQALSGRVHIVFVTAYDQYAITAFEQGAVDYLLKPAEPERVALTCERLRTRIQRAPDPMDRLLDGLAQRLGSGVVRSDYLRWVQASVGPHLRMIPTSDILFFRAEDKRLTAPYWSGNPQPDASDLYFMVVARWGRWLEDSALRMPNIEKFFRRMTERPAVARAMEREAIKPFGT
jgi:DNA-binding LytR/AlgR family response regulator